MVNRIDLGISKIDGKGLILTADRNVDVLRGVGRTEP